MKQESERRLQRVRGKRVEDAKKAKRQRSIAVRVLAATGIALGVGGGIVYNSQHSQETPVLTATLPLSSPPAVQQRGEVKANVLTDEKQIDELISRLDTGMDNLYPLLQNKLANRDPQERQLLLEPLEVYRKNKQNPERNQMRKAREMIARATADGQAPEDILLQNPGYFLINGIYNSSFVAALYQERTRIMYIPPTFDPNNISDLSTAYHELTHVAQADSEYNRLTTQEQVDYYESLIYNNDMPMVFSTKEADAYTRQVFLVDALTDGQLQADAITGKIDLDKWDSILHTRPDQESDLAVLFNMAAMIYQSGSNLTYHSAEFKQFVNDNYRANGVLVYDFDSSGNIVILPDGQ